MWHRVGLHSIQEICTTMPLQDEQPQLSDLEGGLGSRATAY
jgi:hypothetical protein